MSIIIDDALDALLRESLQQCAENVRVDHAAFWARLRVRLAQHEDL
ncbi:MAG: hypothetical protein LBU67_02635 [Oscillospiraceae bacterium]|jgi:hypothetical protein|nr:hypothetical protein [Oscillospiraceae bacterium]